MREVDADVSPMPRPEKTSSTIAACREIRRITIRVWQTVVVWRERLVFFTYHPRQGEGAVDGRVRIFKGRAGVPTEVRAQFIAARGRTLWLVMWFRMWFGGATLLTLSENGTLSAYGWMRVSDPFVRRYRWLTPRGRLLGYFWVAPASRRRGLFGTLLNTCVALSGDRRALPIVVYADSTNAASIGAIEKTGFARLGTFEVTSGALGLYVAYRAVEVLTTIRDVWAGAGV